MKPEKMYSILCILLMLPMLSMAQGDEQSVDWRELNSMVTNADSAEQTPSSQSKIILLDFWASWCGPCRQSFPWMNAMKDKYGDKGLQILAINLDSEQEDAQEFLSEVKASFDIRFDQEGLSATLLGVEAMPMSYLLDKAGAVLHRMAGFNSDKQELHESHIRESLGLN
jgi:thiol-disulfide isomerase/thioredoxin